ncbi:CASP8-associated protein 2 [Nothobranchius furzeri]|nr:CASP8-associated protein 2 isoform X2 [Nothobranchius furzeri]
MQVLLTAIKRTLEKMEAGEASGSLPPGVSEDSMDLYGDLGVGISSNADKSSPVCSELRESLDLYEDLVAEEQLSRESSYDELKSKLQEAQTQIRDLHTRLEQMEVQNLGLSKENHSLKKNISALLRTARQEVTRKDAEIQRLTQWVERGRINHPSEKNRLQHVNSSVQTSTAGSKSRPTPLPSSGLPPAPQSQKSNPSGDPAQASRKGSTSSSRSSEASSHERPTRDPESADRPTKPDKQRFRKPSESADGRRSNKDSHDSKGKRTRREDTERTSDYQSCNKRKRVEGDFLLGGSKTSSSSLEHKKEDRQDQRPDGTQKASADNIIKVLGSRGGSDYKNVKHEKHSSSKDVKNSSGQHGERNKDREGNRQKDPQRKAHRDHESSRRHHRSSHPPTSRERDKPRPKDGSKDRVDKKRPERTPKRPPEGPVTDGSSPNRKLCFMEILNLTLSPNKKSPNASPDEPAEKGAETKPDEEDSQINIRDMCVIDEVDNCHLDFDHTGPSPGPLKDTITERRMENLKDVQKEDRADSSGQIQLLDPVDQVHLVPKLVDVSEPCEDGAVVAPNSQVTDKSCSSSTLGNVPSNTSDPPAGVGEQLTGEPQRRSHDTTTGSTVMSHSEDMDISEIVAKEDCLKGGKAPAYSPPMCLQDRCSPSSTSATPGEREGTRGSDSVSSTTSLDSVPQEGVSLTEAIYILTKTDVDLREGSPGLAHPSPGCTGVSKVSSTTEEKTLPDKYNLLSVTPQKYPTKVHGSSMDMPSPVPLFHDEDSMMRTLSGLRRLPDAISPLRSPVRITKRSLVFIQNKPGHVKRLHKDFSTSAADPSSKKLDVNKDGTYPGSPSKCETQNQVTVGSDVPLSVADTDLEEGEILSESDEASSPHAPATKRPPPLEPVRNKTSAAPVLRKRSEERRVSPRETREAAGASTPSPRSRFKTVCPAASKASFSTEEEIMETFKVVRTEIRKKYMKLHKTFPKKSFYGVMDNFQKSFVEFVEGADFGQICSHPEELKSKLRKLIDSVFCKVLNNGIVKRIFEQQAVDLKQKLWDFVDIQVDYLFKDINGTLKSLCKPAKALAKDRKSSAEDRKSSAEDRKSSAEDRKSSAEDRKSSAEDRKSSAEDRKSSAEDRKSSAEDRKSSAEDRKSSAEDRKSSAEDRKSSAEDRKSSAEDRKSSAEDRKSSAEDRKSSAEDRKSSAEDRKSSAEDRKSGQASVEKSQCKPKEAPQPPGLNRTSSYRTGLGSRGKDIRMTSVEVNSNPPNYQNTHSVVELLPCKSPPQTPDTRISSLLVSQNSSMLDKTDFELLTEQQTSSLTYNLVRDAQMGEIFKCLLQGSDLLDSGGLGGDGMAWAFGTPRKDEERFLGITTPSKFSSPSKLLTPAKFDTPHKLLATWSSISPHRVLSPQAKHTIPLNPAVFDESCLLEVPSQNRMLLQTSQKSYSILAEDLAVSLTLPSPLKSDSHLSFLQPSSMQMGSTPDSVISAHFSEDARLDEEDATEHDIRLILDTDNSSSGNSSSVTSETLATPFVFKPDVPMRALVTEKSNDHFIVKIQHAKTSLSVSVNAEERLAEDQQPKDHGGLTDKSPDDPGAPPSDDHRPNITGDSGLGQIGNESDHHVVLLESITAQHSPPNAGEDTSTEHSPSTGCPEENLPSDLNKASGSDQYSVMGDLPENPTNPRQEPPSEEPQEPLRSSADTKCSHIQNQQSHIPQDAPESRRRPTINAAGSPGKDQKICNQIRKRKKQTEKVKDEKCRGEEESLREMTPSRKDNEESNLSPSALSPSSLSAKNLVRKKGEVVMAWTRDEDRAILVDLKKNGASRETFNALSEKLNKPSGQIAHRFYQLMKLFKKQKMDT